MSVTVNRLEETADVVEEISPHEVINLLLSGAMDRIEGAIQKVSDGDTDTAIHLVQKTTNIIAELRNSLNFKDGGDIAVNLDAVYEYVSARLEAINITQEPISVLEEVHRLISEIHSGWSGISDEAQPA